MKDREWEELCDGCGKCCSFGASGVACPGLDAKTNRCTVYDKRHTTYVCLKVRPDNVLHLHSRGILPDSCAYVRHVLGQPPLERPVQAAELVPFVLAPKRFQRAFRRYNKAWLRLKDERKLVDPTVLP